MSLRDRSAHNTQSHSYSMPGKMSTTSFDELEIGPNIMSTMDTTRKPAKPSDKPIKIQCFLKISQYPLFDKKNHPTKRASTLAEL